VVFRDEHVIEGTTSYGAGHTARHEFDIPVPDMKTPEFLNSPLAQALGAAAALLSSSRSELRWVIEARLDAAGVDLADSVRVYLNIQ